MKRFFFMPRKVPKEHFSALGVSYFFHIAFEYRTALILKNSDLDYKI